MEGVYIYSRPLDGPRGPDIYSWVTVLHTGGASGFHVTGLGKYTRYEFFLIPFFRAADGRPSNSRVIRTKEDGKLKIILIDVVVVNFAYNLNNYFFSSI